VKVHPLCQPEMPDLQGFFELAGALAEKLAGSNALKAAISTAP
jgi:hypothetical protein